MRLYILAITYVLLRLSTCVPILEEQMEEPPQKKLKILAFMPTDGNGHFLGFKPLFEELVSRGHELTLVSPFELDNVTQPYRHVKVEKTSPDVDITFKYAGFLNNIISTTFRMWWNGPYVSELSLNKSSVMDFIINDRSSFDLVMFENFYHECFAAIGHKYKAQIVQMVPFSASTRVWNWQKNYLEPAFVPNLSKVFGLTLMEKISNMVTDILYSVMDELIYLPRQQEIANKYFVYPGHENRPELTEILRNITLTLVNRHPLIGLPFLQVGSYLNVAGMHCKPAKQLPEDLLKIMDNSQHGVVYFSLGLYMETSDISKDFLLVVISELAKIKQTVLWKWDFDDLPNLPKNIIVRDWFPQNDVLGHPNCKLFITHGGVHSVLESVYHGVPILYIPVFGNKLGNSFRGQYYNIGIQVPYLGLTREAFTTALQKLLKDDKYTVEANIMSTLFKNNPLTPLDTTVKMVEHAHKYGLTRKVMLQAMHKRSKREGFFQPIPIHVDSYDSDLNLYRGIEFVLLVTWWLLILILYYFSRVIFTRIRGVNRNLRD